MSGIRTFGRLVSGAVVLASAFFCFGSSAQANTFTVSNLAGDISAGGLYAAMDAANANPADKDTIVFSAGLKGTIALSDDLPELTGPVTITGPGSGDVTVAGTAFTPRHMFRTSKDLTLTGLRLQYGTDPANGGSISSTGGNLVLKDIQVVDAHAFYGKGGGLYVSGGSVDIEDSAFVSNLAPAGGGAWIEGTTSASISNTMFAGNTARYYFAGPEEDPNTGGGLVVEGSGTLDIDGSVIKQNSAATDGAAFAVSHVGNVTIKDTFVDNNSSEFTVSPDGYDAFGTARIVADKTTITGSQFTGNLTSFLSGLQVIGPATISGSLIADNQSGGLATGLTLGEFDGKFTPSTVTATVSNTTISGNSGGNLGVGLISTVAKLNLESSTITGNKVLFPVYPTANAAGLVQMTGTATVSNSIVSGNDPADISALATLPESPQPTLDLGGYVEGSYNLIGTSTGRKFKDLVAGSNIISNDPKLGKLAYNEGGGTQTMMPEPGSPVIDQGLSKLPTDQNGLKRTVDLWIPNAKGGNGTDIGAVEVRKIAPPPNKFSFGKLKPNKKKGTATLQVKVPAPGKVQLLGSKTTKAFKKTAPDKGTVVLTIRAKGKAAKQLAKKHRLTLKVKVRFSPTGGTPKTLSKSVKLVKN